MGWDNAHLHAFNIAGREYSDPHEVDDAADEERLTVNGVLRSGVSRFTYTYDFGDNWEHAIVIECGASFRIAGPATTTVAGVSAWVG